MFRLGTGHCNNIDLSAGLSCSCLSAVMRAIIQRVARASVAGESNVHQVPSKLDTMVQLDAHWSDCVGPRCCFGFRSPAPKRNLTGRCCSQWTTRLLVRSVGGFVCCEHRLSESLSWLDFLQLPPGSNRYRRRHRLACWGWFTVAVAKSESLRRTVSTALPMHASRFSVGICQDDTREDLDYIASKILNTRVFENEAGKSWAKSVSQNELEILCVSQFTLYAKLKG